MAPSRFLLSLVLLPVLSAVHAQHDHDMAPAKPTAAEPPTKQRLPAPEGCRKLPTDADWPTQDVVNTELKGWEAPMVDAGEKHPNWMYEVKTVASAQRAVNFARKQNVRISVLNSGHDFLGR
jgi:hypothetical protein